jgi:hypothetical protein
MLLIMGKKMTKAGMVTRRAIHADIDTNPAIDHVKLRSKYRIQDQVITSAMTKTVAEWDTLIAATPDDQPSTPRVFNPPETRPGSGEDVGIAMPGIEQGVVKFTRKPAKMGEDYILWIPRVYIKNGLVDHGVEYEIFLKKKT